MTHILFLRELLLLIILISAELRENLPVSSDNIPPTKVKFSVSINARTFFFFFSIISKVYVNRTSCECSLIWQVPLDSG